MRAKNAGKAKKKAAGPSITIRAASDLELADALEAAARQIRTKAKGGNWRLSAMMQQRGLLDRDVAAVVGSTLQAVYYWRRGLRAPGLASLGKIAALMECRPEDLGFTADGRLLE